MKQKFTVWAIATFLLLFSLIPCTLAQKEVIKIGFLVQDSKSVDASNGAQMAIEKANTDRLYQGKVFELVLRNMEGPWGTGSKQAVSLIFDENVFAIAGSHDGRNAHLVEQATTKSHIAFVSCRAGDPTLSQAFTPWFFNVVPNDNQQAEILVTEIFIKKKFKNITLITDNEYDALSASKSFIRIAEAKGIKNYAEINLKDSGADLSKPATLLNKSTEAVVIFTGITKAAEVIKQLEVYGKDLNIYGPLFLLDNIRSAELPVKVEKNIVLLTSGFWYKEGQSEFSTDFRNKYGYFPGPAAAYAYDAINILIKAIGDSDFTKEKVYKILLNSDNTGVTGRLMFDEKGNRRIGI